MKLELLKNGNIFIEKDGEYYIIEKAKISGTLIYNYFVYKDVYNDLDYFKNEDSNENKYWCGDYETLEKALYMIYNNECN